MNEKEKTKRVFQRRLRTMELFEGKSPSCIHYWISADKNRSVADAHNNMLNS